MRISANRRNDDVFPSVCHRERVDVLAVVECLHELVLPIRSQRHKLDVALPVAGRDHLGVHLAQRPHLTLMQVACVRE